MKRTRLDRHSPATYFAMVTALSVPLWLADRLLGGRKLPTPIPLPLSALMFVTPALAAWLLAGRTGWRTRAKGVKPGWYLAAFIVFPLIGAVTAQVGGQPLAYRQVPQLALLYALPAWCEEAGWLGYAYPRLRKRHRPLIAALLIGGFAAAWHVVPDLINGRGLGWIAGQRLGTLSGRVLITWLYVEGGNSVGVATVAHAMDNVAVSLFRADAYPPVVYGLVTTVAAAGVARRLASGSSPDTTPHSPNG